VEIDSLLGCVRRGGQEYYLRQQCFQVLLYVLKRHDRLVSKEELIENFWHDTAVTDNAVVQCVAEIRRALGDDPRDPRFIKTIPKAGYRFIAPVIQKPTAAEPVKDPGLAAILDIPGPSRSQGLRRWTALGLAALAVLAAMGWAVVRQAGTAAKVTLRQVPGRKSLAVMYFENQSGRPDLNWLSEGLADMFISDLAHFDRLSVLSRQQLHLLLERTRRRRTNEIPLDEALDVARKSHADGVLLGSFMTLGKKILISARLFDAANGQLTAADQFVVEDPSDIVTQVDLLAPKLAAHLGTGAAEASKRAGLADVMTRNIEAYRYYSLGVSKAQAFQNAEAVALLRKAIQLDSKFAMAYARIGYAYSVTDFLPEKGRPFLKKAIQLSDHLTAKDRLSVMAWDAIARQEYPEAIRILRQIVDRYPMETEAYTRLARLLYREERPEETIDVVRRGLAVDPDYGDLYNVLGVCFLGLTRYQEAITAHERYVQLAPNEPNAHDSLGMSFQQSGAFDRATAEYNAALALDPEFEPAIIHLGDVYYQQGRYHEAVAQYERYVQVTGSDTAKAIGYGSIAKVYVSAHDFNRAEHAARYELKFEKGAVWNSLLIAIGRGEKANAASLRQSLVRNVPYPGRGSRSELRSYDYYLGVLALRDKRPDEAIAHFQQALRHLPPSSGLDLYEDCLANAYLELSRLDEAIREYQRILRRNPNYPLAQYHLAEAYRRKGKPQEARSAYQQFLQNWKNADPGVPEVRQARRELTALGAKAG
jgi:tetratricopeptide (TPR) repeat protein/DNA-binding winged helix-turn-helix (wHTH) protein